MDKQILVQCCNKSYIGHLFRKMIIKVAGEINQDSHRDTRPPALTSPGLCRLSASVSDVCVWSQRWNTASLAAPLTISAKRET